MANFFTRLLQPLYQPEIDKRLQLILTGQDGFYDRGVVLTIGIALTSIGRKYSDKP